METAENLVVRNLEGWGFRCERFTKEEMRDRKTPDRRVYRGGELAFFLEVKEIPTDDWAGGDRADPRPNRLTSDIHEAIKQFDSVNPDREYANVLAFVNRDSMCGSLDLYAVLTGDALTSHGGALPIYRKQALGRIRDEKFRVDAYLWFDDFNATKVFVNEANRRHSDRLREYFEGILGDVAG